MDRRKWRPSRLIIPLCGVIVILILVVLGYVLLCRPGELVFDDSVSNEQKNFLENALYELKFTDDVTISSEFQTARSEQGVLYDILVPVTDFYSTETTATSDANWISINDLDYTKKLLRFNDHYFLDDLDAGARFQYLMIDANEKDLEMIQDKLSTDLPVFPTRDSVLSFAQTGVTALARGMTKKLETIDNPTFFTQKIRGFLGNFDLLHTSNEASFSEKATARNICAKPVMIDVLTNLDVNIVELTGNHNQDCGDNDSNSTIDQYAELGIQTFGGGKTATQAATPLLLNQKNNGITLLGYNLSTGGYTLDDTPGANYYNEEDLINNIATAKERGDFVIVDMQYYECSEYDSVVESDTCDYADSSAGDQIGTFRHLIDLGADLVVGTSAHQPQTFELYGDGAIYYGLGNLFFDQSAWPGTTRSLVLAHYFWQGKLLQTRIVPTNYDDSYQTALMDEENAAKYLERLINARPVLLANTTSETNETDSATNSNSIPSNNTDSAEGGQ